MSLVCDDGDDDDMSDALRGERLMLPSAETDDVETIDGINQ